MQKVIYQKFDNSEQQKRTNHIMSHVKFFKQGQINNSSVRGSQTNHEMYNELRYTTLSNNDVYVQVRPPVVQEKDAYSRLSTIKQHNSEHDQNQTIFNTSLGQKPCNDQGGKVGQLTPDKSNYSKPTRQNNQTSAHISTVYEKTQTDDQQNDSFCHQLGCNII